MEKIFTEKNDVELYLRNGIAHVSTLYEQFPGLEEAVILEFRIEDVSKIRPGALALSIKKFRWVIKDDDIQLIESIFDGLKSAAGANFFLTVASAPRTAFVTSIVGIAGALFKILRNARNKGKVLAKEQFKVIVCLKNHPEGLTFDQLYSLINISAETITKDELMTVINSLRTIYSSNGNKIELVILENNFYKAPGI